MKARQAALQVTIVVVLLLGGLAAASAQVLTADPTVTPANPVVGPGKTQVFTAASVSPSTFGSMSSMSAGQDHTCGLLPNGTVDCWGLNAWGQLGNGTTTNSSVPVPVSGLSGVTAVSAGNEHTCALLTGGTVACWGDNTFGQLGTGNNTPSLVPVPVPGLSRIKQIAAGYQETCAVFVDGSVECWGAIVNSPTPVSVPAAAGGVVQYAQAIAGGAGQGGQATGHMCILDDGGQVICWGSNRYGQLGSSSTGAAAPADNIFGAIAVAVGNSHTCALMPDGTVQCWGWNSWGQLGNGTTTDSVEPQAVQGLAGRAIGIAAGYDHTCALLDNGTAQCWGQDEYGLGDGTIGNDEPYTQPTPVTVAGLNGATSLIAGGSHSCALLASGSAQC